MMTMTTTTLHSIDIGMKCARRWRGVTPQLRNNNNENRSRADDYLERNHLIMSFPFLCCGARVRKISSDSAASNDIINSKQKLRKYSHRNYRIIFCSSLRRALGTAALTKKFSSADQSNYIDSMSCGSGMLWPSSHVFTFDVRTTTGDDKHVLNSVSSLRNKRIYWRPIASQNKQFWKRTTKAIIAVEPNATDHDHPNRHTFSSFVNCQHIFMFAAISSLLFTLCDNETNRFHRTHPFYKFASIKIPGKCNKKWNARGVHFDARRCGKLITKQNYCHWYVCSGVQRFWGSDRLTNMTFVIVARDAPRIWINPSAESRLT